LAPHSIWGPSHSKVLGNELADHDAKEAATSNETPTSCLIPPLISRLPRNAAILSAYHKQTSMVQWCTERASSLRAVKLVTRPYTARTPHPQTVSFPPSPLEQSHSTTPLRTHRPERHPNLDPRHPLRITATLEVPGPRDCHSLPPPASNT
jgi:hypothetical protein